METTAQNPQVLRGSFTEAGRNVYKPYILHAGIVCRSLRPVYLPSFYASSPRLYFLAFKPLPFPSTPFMPSTIMSLQPSPFTPSQFLTRRSSRYAPANKPHSTSWDDDSEGAMASPHGFIKKRHIEVTEKLVQGSVKLCARRAQRSTAPTINVKQGEPGVDIDPSSCHDLTYRWRRTASRNRLCTKVRCPQLLRQACSPLLSGKRHSRDSSPPLRSRSTAIEVNGIPKPPITPPRPTTLLVCEPPPPGWTANVSRSWKIASP
jgi:hypothetical protein